MKATVIIPTRDRADMLDDCLHSLRAQSLPASEFEVIVVDNNSTDHTREVAKAHQSHLRLKYAFAEEPGLHVGRHLGLRLASSDILVFADDDIVTGEDWLRSILETFEDPTVALVGGNNLPLFEHRPPDWLSLWWSAPVERGRALAYLSILDFGTGVFEVNPHWIWGCNFAIRRDALTRAGGFHPDALPADRIRWRGDGETHVSEWIRSNGLKAMFNSGATVQHHVPAARMRPEYFARRGYSQGISDSYSDIRHSATQQRAWFSQSPNRLLLNRLRSIHARCKSAPTHVERQLRDVKLAALRGWRAGYRFHQQAVCEDPDLLAWVTKATYL